MEIVKFKVLGRLTSTTELGIYVAMTVNQEYQFANEANGYLFS